MNRPALRPIAMLVCALALAACGGAGTSESTVGLLTIEASDYRFQPSSANLAAGREIIMVLKNSGQQEHDFTLASGPGVAAPQAHSDHAANERPYHVAAQPGQQATLKLKLEPGAYTYICSVAGHEALGMRGTLTVQ